MVDVNITFLFECQRGNSHFTLFTGRNVSLETSWTTWGTMTLWCCACLKEATSSVLTWWKGSRLLAATPVARSPWGSISSVSRATWWASAHCNTESTQTLTAWHGGGLSVNGEAPFMLKFISLDESHDLVRRCVSYILYNIATVVSLCNLAWNVPQTLKWANMIVLCNKIHIDPKFFTV